MVRAIFSIDSQSRVPVYEQIVSQAERFVLTGVLHTDAAVPSVRALAMDLSANPNTIQKAYMELERRGVIYSVPGKGTFITETARDKIAQSRLVQLDIIEQAAGECRLAGIAKEKTIEAVERGYAGARPEGVKEA